MGNNERDVLARMNLRLDMTRGRPSPAQLNLLDPFLSVLSPEDCVGPEGDDLRNYGGDIAGLASARALFGRILDVPDSNVMIGGNSSLSLMHETMLRAMWYGVGGKAKPWGQQGQVKGIVLIPAYDRHVRLSESLGIELIPVRIRADGSYWDQVEHIVARDPMVKLAWVVPRYSNCSGHSLSDAEMQRMAAMRTAADDFYWMIDHAYAVHHLVDEPPPFGNLFRAFHSAGTEDRFVMFGSTAKITWASAAISAMAGSDRTIRVLKDWESIRTIGPNKLAQLQNVMAIERFPGGLPGLMRAHAGLLRPRFQAVEDVLSAQLSGREDVSWTHPEGGYFVTVNLKGISAAKVIANCNGLGVKLTPAGATWPKGIDPEDSTIRLAPSVPTVEEVTLAARVLAYAIESEVPS